MRTIRPHTAWCPALILALAPTNGPAAATNLVVARSYAPGGARTAGPAPARFLPLDPEAASADSSTHVVYFVPKDKPDENLDGNGTLARSIESMRAWFGTQMGKAPRVDRTPGSSAYDIAFVRGQQDSSAYTSLNIVSAELGARGYSSSSTRYLIYAAMNLGNICGEGYYPTTPMSETGHYAIVYLDSEAGCGARDFGGGSAQTAGKAETIAAHEWLHNEGVEPMSAPHHCATSPYHVCTGPLWVEPELDPENVDVVFPIITARLSGKQLDRDHDDYLDHPWPHISNLRDSVWLEDYRP